MWLRAPDYNNAVYFPKEDGFFELQEDIPYGTLIVEESSNPHGVIEGPATSAALSTLYVPRHAVIWPGAGKRPKPSSVREEDTLNNSDNAGRQPTR